MVEISIIILILVYSSNKQTLQFAVYYFKSKQIYFYPNPNLLYRVIEFVKLDTDATLVIFSKEQVCTENVYRSLESHAFRDTAFMAKLS